MANLLFVYFDDLFRFLDRSTPFRQQMITPNLDALVAGGVDCTKSLCQVAVCKPSRTSTLMGQSPIRTQVLGNFQRYSTLPVDLTKSLPVWLQQHGFKVGIAGKVFHPDTESNNIISPLVDRFHPFFADGDQDESGVGHGIGVLEENQTPDWLTANQIIDFIGDKVALNQDFAAFSGFYKPHQPLNCPQEFYDLYPIGSIELPLPTGPFDALPAYAKSMLSNPNYHARVLRDGVWDDLVQAYFACTSFADHQLGRVLQALVDEGVANDTLVVAISDHGYHLGDKDRWRKYTLWNEALHVPCVMKFPGTITAGTSYNEAMSLKSLYPTICDFLSVTTAGLTLDGVNHADAITGGAPVSETVEAWMYGSFIAFDGDYIYTYYSRDGLEQLHDWNGDYEQNTDLATNPAFNTIKANLKAAVIAEQKIIIGTPGADTMTGTVGNDVFIGYGAFDLIQGGAGNDVYFQEPESYLTQIVEPDAGGIDIIHMRDGGTLALPKNVEKLDSRQGHRKGGRLVGNKLNNEITGTGGKDEIYGGHGDDWLQSGGSDSIGGDSMFGGPGNDTAFGGHMGADKVYLDGGSGNDSLVGGPTEDTIKGGTGNDTATAGGGNDVVEGGAGADTLYGGTGSDTIRLGDDTVADRVMIDQSNTEAKRLEEFFPQYGDKIRIKPGSFDVASPTEVLARCQQVGIDTVIQLTRVGSHANATLTLAGVNVADLTVANFEVV